MRLSAVLPLALVVLLGALAPEATAAPEEATEKVLGMQVEAPDLSAKDRSDLLQVVQAKVHEYPSLDLVKPPESEVTDLMIELECIELDAGCLARLGEKYGATRVFFADIQEGDAAWELRVRVVDTEQQQVIHESSTTVPAQADLAGRLEKEVESAFGPPPPPKPKDGTLVVAADVAGARIFVNGEYAGTGRIEMAKAPGTYSVRVTRDGYGEDIFDVEVTAGETAERSVTLEALPTGAAPAAPPEDETEKPLYKQWWLWTAVGVVITATAVGVGLAASGDDDAGGPRGGVTLSVDPGEAWKDTTLGRAP
ncbi:MAG: PEGA domain-containing protein [Myxococcota bacterium]